MNQKTCGVVIVALILAPIAFCGLASAVKDYAHPPAAAYDTPAVPQGQGDTPVSPAPAGVMWVSDGTYLVGTDIPASLYKGDLYGTASPYWELARDANGKSIIANDIPNGPFYIDASAGEYLKLRGVAVWAVNSR